MRFKRRLEPLHTNPPQRKERKPKTAKKPKRKRDPFYASYEWKTLRYDVLKESDGRCALCGRNKKDYSIDLITKLNLTVDHIVSRHIDQSRELDRDNLQILCSDCHEAKKVEDCTDFRNKY